MGELLFVLLVSLFGSSVSHLGACPILGGVILVIPAPQAVRTVSVVLDSPDDLLLGDGFQVVG